MKLIQVALAVFLVIATVEVVALPNNPPVTTTESVAEPVGKIQKRDPKRHSHPWCWLPGQACTKKAKKRHDDPQSIESQEVKETQNPWCWMPGQVCTKAKRQQVESEAAF